MKFAFFFGSLLMGSAIMFGSDTTSIPVTFTSAKNSTTVHGSIKGYKSIDYLIKASAGQKLNVSMKSTSNSNSFNVYAPDSDGTAMSQPGNFDNAYSGILPNDGVYVVRVYLVRAAARRNETSSFDLSIQIDGKALKPLSAKQDAFIKGSNYHAKGIIACKPAYKPSTQCDAMVIRRSFDGTATVVIKNETMTRQIFFEKGTPTASDTFVPMSYKKEPSQDVIRVLFDQDESYDIPNAFVFGG